MSTITLNNIVYDIGTNLFLSINKEKIYTLPACRRWSKMHNTSMIKSFRAAIRSFGHRGGLPYRVLISFESPNADSSGFLLMDLVFLPCHELLPNHRALICDPSQQQLLQASCTCKGKV